MLTNPRRLGSAVTLSGRVRECADLLQGGDRLLDIGCSSGWLSDIAVARGFREYVGFDRAINGDPSPRQGVRFLSGSAQRLPFADQSFDAVAIFDLIQELPAGSDRQVLREAHRVLQAGGALYLSAPHASVIHTPLDPVWYLGRRHYRLATITRLVASCGFTVEQIFVAGGLAECLFYLGQWLGAHLFHKTPATPSAIARWIEADRGKRRRLGQTVFVVARRQASR